VKTVTLVNVLVVIRLVLDLINVAIKNAAQIVVMTVMVARNAVQMGYSVLRLALAQPHV